MSYRSLGTNAGDEPGRPVKVLAFAVALACACLFCGAIPWLTVPTLGQSLWASGFAQSYANADHLTIYAHDIGFPHPAPIAFGLPATFVQGLLIRWLGIGAIDAYTLTFALFLMLALWGATALARSFGAPFALALASGLLWLSLPIVGQHVGYSMLALGFALLPSYLHMAGKIFSACDRRAMVCAAVGFAAASVVAIFMDGYTFMMFAVATCILWLGNFMAARVRRRRLLLFAGPAIAVGLALAYILYVAFIGGDSYALYPLDFFRGWGVDVVMLLQPTRGIHWLWDLLGTSAARNPNIFWGDASVWMTSFALPLLVAGISGFASSRKSLDGRILLAMAVVGFYLALGPSLKIDSTKQAAGVSEATTGPLMPPQYAIGPTGSGVLSLHVPGFRQMRASYRWIGLGELGLWGLTVLLIVRLRSRPAVAFAVLGILVVMFMPHIPRVLRDGLTNRHTADAIADALVPALHEAAGSHGRVFFAPHGNDFVASYIAPLAGLTSYNIGGDKNVAIAKMGWPQAMRQLGYSNLGTDVYEANIRLILLTGDVDAVVFPYFDMLTASWIWPVDPRTVATLRNQRIPVARAVASAPCFQLREFPLFASVSLSSMGHAERERLASGDAAHATSVCRLRE